MSPSIHPGKFDLGKFDWPSPSLLGLKAQARTLAQAMGLGCLCCLACLCLGLWQSPALAALAPSQQPLESLHLDLGTPAEALKFVPAQLQLQAGKRYRLTFDNPSSQKHYFTAKDFADSIWSQKVDAGNVEVKGAIHELEIRPSATADWVFIPQKPGTYEFHCSIPGHAEAGMVGTIQVLAP